MGKGAGNVCGNASVDKPSPTSAPASGPADIKAPLPHQHAPPAQQAPPATEKTVVVAQTAPLVKAEEEKSVKVFIIFYSMYGHVEKLARAAKEGIDSVKGVQGVLYQVAETLPAEVLGKLHAPEKPQEIPIIDASTLAEADGFLFGFPTRFGLMPAQMKALFDQTGQLWLKGALAGKPAGFFTSTGSQHGGQEVTILGAIGQLAHHGMLYVPLDISKPDMVRDVVSNDVVHGGSPYGSGTIAGPKGELQPSELELRVAKAQGQFLGEVAKKLKA